jgi:hypothetical protein
MGRATALKRAVQPPPDKVGDSVGVYREEGETTKTRAPHLYPLHVSVQRGEGWRGGVTLAVSIAGGRGYTRRVCHYVGEGRNKEL